MRRWPRITLRIAVASTSQRHAGTTLVASKQDDTRYEARHPIRSNAPDQKRCNACRSGAAPQTTTTNAEAGSERRHDKTTPGPPQPHHNNTPRSGLNTTPQNPGLHNVSVTWARQVVALTLSCAAGPDTWSMGTPAHAPPIGLTCASKGPSTHPSGRTCHPTAGRSRGPQHVLQPHIARDTLNTRHLRTPLTQSAVHLSYNSPFSPVLTEPDDGLSSNPKLRPS